MEAIRRIPKVLDRIEDIHAEDGGQVALSEYKKSVKMFIGEVQKQVNRLIDNYEKEIQRLKNQNQRLKQQFCETKQFVRTSPIKQFSSLNQSMNKPLELMQTAKSNMFTPFKQDQIKLSRVLSKYRSSQDNHFPEQLINPQPQEDFGKSRFEIKNSRKKQRQQELLHFLQTGRKNLDYNTNKFLNVVGKNKVQSNKEDCSEFKDNDGSNSSKSQKKEQMINQSLGNICNSLDTSYISKKSRSQKKKRMNNEQDQKKRKKQQEQEMVKLMKQRGLKSLLQRLRDNVQSSPTRPPETIKVSKLIGCGQNKSKGGSPQRKGSKVLINPVPVDIEKKRNLGDRQMNSPTFSPQRKPQSILKQTSNILTRSLSGISAIQFKTD